MVGGKINKNILNFPLRSDYTLDDCEFTQVAFYWKDLMEIHKI